MKRRIMLILVMVLFALSLCACNRQTVDLTYSYDHAIISLPNGEIVSGAVESWRDYEDGDQIQVKIDGKIYLAHSENVVLIKD